MNTHTFVATCWTALVISCGSAFAQDMNRVPDMKQGMDGVDASVHADVEERALQTPPPAQEPVKTQTTYSRWGINSSGQHPATRYGPAHTSITTSVEASGDGESPSNLSPFFQAGARPLASLVWSARSSDPTVKLANGGNSGKPERQPDPFNGLDIGRTQYSTGLQRFKTIVPPLSPQPQADGFSTPFREERFGLASGSFFLPPAFPKTIYSSQRDRATASWSKSRTKKSLDSKHTGASAEISSAREKPGRSRLTTKAD